MAKYNLRDLDKFVKEGKITIEQAQDYAKRNGLAPTTSEMQGNEPNVNTDKQVKAKKSKVPVFIGLGVCVLMLIGVSVVLFRGKNSEPEVTTEAFVFDNSIYQPFVEAMHNYDAETIDSLVGNTTGDSYLAYEWSYANLDKDKEDFIKSVCGVFDFVYPTNANETLQMQIPDYAKITDTLINDIDYVKQLYKASGYKESSYTYYQDVYDLALYYIYVKFGTDLPVTTDACPAVIVNGVLNTDDFIDDALFGSDAWHNYLDEFQKIITDYTETVQEPYTVTEIEDNPEYDEWFELFIQYYEADGGTYDAETDTFSGGRFTTQSKWEPWYLRDKDNPDVILKDENGENIINYYTVKRDDGTDWVQPDRRIEVEVTKYRDIDNPFIAEQVVRYGYLGSHWISLNPREYDTTVQYGDGTIEYPAGIGTSIITKLLCTDGKYHDVRVAITGYWIGQDAIDYAIEFSDRNRGFVSDSVVQLICFEYKIENLEDKPITFESGEFCLMNKSAGKSPRNGTLYGFTSGYTLKAHESVTLNDWMNSTELAYKYLCWGSSFDRQYPVVYFRLLAAEDNGSVPTYSAYNFFIKKEK